MSELAIASSRGQARLDALRRAAYRLRQSALSLVGLVLVVMLLVVAAAGPWMAPYADQLSGAINATGRLQPPSAAHWMGTNELGQDVFTLVLGGARISLFAGLAVVLLGAVVGTVIGAIAGYLGGWTDEVLMRFTDLALTLPGLILAMAVAAALGAGTGHMVLAIALTWWPGYARLVRGEVLARREDVYVLAARALGAGPRRIMARHMASTVRNFSPSSGICFTMSSELRTFGVGEGEEEGVCIGIGGTPRPPRASDKRRMPSERTRSSTRPSLSKPHHPDPPLTLPAAAST